MQTASTEPELLLAGDGLWSGAFAWLTKLLVAVGAGCVRGWWLGSSISLKTLWS